LSDPPIYRTSPATLSRRCSGGEKILRHQQNLFHCRVRPTPLQEKNAPSADFRPPHAANEQLCRSCCRHRCSASSTPPRSSSDATLLVVRRRAAGRPKPERRSSERRRRSCDAAAGLAATAAAIIAGAAAARRATALVGHFSLALARQAGKVTKDFSPPWRRHGDWRRDPE